MKERKGYQKWWEMNLPEDDKTSEFVGKYSIMCEQTRTYSFLFPCLLVDWEMERFAGSLKQEEEQHSSC